MNLLPPASLVLGTVIMIIIIMNLMAALRLGWDHNFQNPQPNNSLEIVEFVIATNMESTSCLNLYLYIVIYTVFK